MTSLLLWVVINRKTTKFESNSQPLCEWHKATRSCYQSQNYKIWKQFTTCWNLTPDPWPLKVVINHKTTKFESNSQLRHTSIKVPIGCYQSQNYEIWKQFTTVRQGVCQYPMLLSITKLRNLKAIHNNFQTLVWLALVVINHKTTKFESNSQRITY